MYENLGKEYAEKGFVVLKGIASTKEIQRYIDIAKRHDHKSSANAIVDYFYDYIRFFDLRLYTKFLKFIDLRYFADCVYLISRSKNQNWKKNISTLNLNDSNAVSRIDSYISKKSNEDILEWHTDQAFGGATHPPEFFGNANGVVPTNNINKLFLHVTDVKYGNGAFSYIPYSHKINITIRNLINKQIIKYKPFLLLQDAIKLVDIEYKEQFLEILEKHEIETFVNSGKKAIENDQEFSIECKAGDAVLFNDFGYHKGTAPKLSDRIIFRYWY
jgi:hypothetical protein